MKYTKFLRHNLNRLLPLKFKESIPGSGPRGSGPHEGHPARRAQEPGAQAGALPVRGTGHPPLALVTTHLGASSHCSSGFKYTTSERKTWSRNSGRSECVWLTAVSPHRLCSPYSLCPTSSMETLYRNKNITMIFFLAVWDITRKWLHPYTYISWPSMTIV